MQKSIVLDMDGTIADFYGVSGWLDALKRHDATPYSVASPYGNSKRINGLLAALQDYGYTVEVVSWLARDSTDKTFNNAVRRAKRFWLKCYYPAINSSNVHIVKHGTDKWRVAKNKDGILFDDEMNNCEMWRKHSASGSAVQITSPDTLVSALTSLLLDCLQTA